MIELQQALKNIIEHGALPSPAMQMIISDYAKYHAVLAVLSGILFMVFLFLSIKFWGKLRLSQGRWEKKWNYESKAYAYFLIVTSLVTGFMLLLVFANMTNTLNPLHGLSLAYNNVPPNVETNPLLGTEQLHQTFRDWVISKDGSIPSEIKGEIEKRELFHMKKAALSIVLLILFAVLGLKTWKKVVQVACEIEAGTRAPKWEIYHIFRIFIANLSVVLSLLLVLVIMANIQGALAPLTAFLVGFLP